MPCDNCNTVSFPITTQNIKSITTQFCSTTPCGADSHDAKCTIYNGPNLSCTGVYTGNNLEHIIQKFDDILCATTGDYSSYNTYCLDDLNPISSQKQFVETISETLCTFKAAYNTFVTSTFVTYQGAVNTRFQAIEVPNVSAPSYIGANSADTLKQTLTKYSTKIGDLNSRLDLSSVVWNNCFSPSTNPTTLPQAFTLINQELCSLKTDIGSGGGGTTLPVFNNTGSCLDSPTATDSLVDTVNKLKTRVCTSPTFDINALSWNCITKPSSTATNLQAAFQSVLTKIDTLSQNFPTFTGDFSLTNVDNSNPCLGKRVALTTSPSADRFVAVNVSDSTPGTLSQKIIAGTGISIDVTTTPGTMIVTSTASGANDKVKSRSADATADYLENKIVGSAATNGITITTTTDTTSNKVKVGSSLNPEQIWAFLFDALDSFPDLKTEFCTRVQACLPDCVIPPAISFIINPSNTSTTTSSTTTTTTTTGL